MVNLLEINHINLLEIILTNLQEVVRNLADHPTKAAEVTLLALPTNLLPADHLTKVVVVAQEAAKVVLLVLPEEVEGINTSMKNL